MGKKLLCAVATIAMAMGCITGGSKPDVTADEFKIVSYNILHGQLMNNKLDITASGKIIAAEKPRFAAIQEVDQKTGRVNGADTCAILAKTTGMHATFAKAINHDGGEYGVALLSREQPLSVRRVPLPGGEKRVLLLCEFKDCWAGVTHLDLNAKRRLESVDLIKKEVGKCGSKPVFLSGDFNSAPESEVMLNFKKFMSVLSGEKYATYHGGNSDETEMLNTKKCIDYVMVSKEHRGRYELRGRRVIHDRITSDHYPVVVSVRPSDGAGKEGRFKIASFNVRCPGDQGDNSYRLRKPRIAQVIKKYGFDIFGVQEAVADLVEYFADELPDFDHIGCGRNKDRGGETMFIFYNRNRFKCLENGTFWLSETPDVPGSRYSGAGCPRTCTWGLFEDRVTGKKFRYFNTHLDHVSHQARVNGAKVIMARGLDGARAKGETIFLTGDMNAEIEKDDNLELLAKIRKTDLEERAKNNPIAFIMTRLTDTVEVSKSGHQGSWKTNQGYRDYNNCRIDYIFATPDVDVFSHTTVNDRPGGKFPSDHDAVVAEVEIAR